MAATQGHTASKAASGVEGRNQWDFLTVLVVIVGLAGVTILLVYKEKATDVEAILGILVPAFAAVFGITLGYATGNAKGTATGKQQARREVRTSLLPKMQDIATTATSLSAPIRTHAVSESGSPTFRIMGDFSKTPINLEMDPADLDKKIQGVQGYLASLD